MDSDRTVRAVVTTGADRMCCAGSDVKGFLDVMRSEAAIDGAFAPENEVYDRLAGLPQPTIAPILGVALGGGAVLSLCC